MNREQYSSMLQWYYQKRGWDSRGIPKEKTLAKLDFKDAAQELSQHVKLTA